MERPKEGFLEELDMLRLSRKGPLPTQLCGWRVQGGVVYGKDCHHLGELGQVVIRKWRDPLSQLSSALRASCSAMQNKPLPSLCLRGS